MRKTFQGFITIVVTLVQLFLPFLQQQQYKMAYADDNTITSQVVNEYGETEELTFTAPSDEEILDSESDGDDGMSVTPEDETISNTGSSTVSSKIVFNPTDQDYVEKYAIISSLTPDLMFDVDELSALSGKSVEDLDDMHWNSFDQFQKLVKQYQDEINDEYLRDKALTMPSVLVKVLGLSSETQAVQEVQNNKDEVVKIIDNILSKKVDRRIVETLNYLVRSKDDPRGGAGHWRVKVSRLFKNYDREQSKRSKESDSVIENNNKTDSEEQVAEETTIESIENEDNTSDLEKTAESIGYDADSTITSGQIEDSDGNTVSDFLINTDETVTNISSHYKGEAIDISELDDIKCTKIERKRIGHDKKTAQAPYNIKFAWQTTDGYAENSSAVNSSFDKMMWNMSQDAIIDLLSEFNIDFNNLDSLNASDFSDVASTIGQAFFAQVLNSSEGNIWNFDLETTLRKLGGVILADTLGLDRGPFLDSDLSSIDGISEAIGRAGIEKKLGFEYDSLKGDDRDKMLINLGKSRILSELKLPLDTLDQGATDDNDLMQRIGARIVETELSLNKWSFYGKSSYSQIKDANGKYKFEALFSAPAGIDSRLGITIGTAKNLKGGSLSPAEFNRLVATAHLLETAYTYQNYNASSDTSTKSTVTDTSALTGAERINWRDEMFNLPKGTIDKFTTGELLDVDYKQVGIFSIATALENSDVGRQNLTTWLNNPTKDFIVTSSITDPITGTTSTEIVNLPRGTYASSLGVAESEVYFFLGSDEPKQTGGAYKRLGKKIFTQALQNSSIIEKQKQSFVNNNPELQEGIQQYEFYQTRFSNIKDHLEPLRQKGEALKSAITLLSDSLFSTSDKSSLTNAINQLNTKIDSSSAGSDISSMISLGQSIAEITNSASANMTVISELTSKDLSARANEITLKINEYTNELEYVAKNAYEIVTGKEQSDFRFEDLSVSQVKFNQISLGGVNVNTADLIMLLSGKISPKSFITTLASSKIANELNLPPKALKYAASLISKYTSKNKDPKVAFFRAIALSSIEQKLNQKGSNLGSGANTEDIADSSTIQQLRDNIASQVDGDTTKANQIVAKAFNLDGYNLEYLMRGDFGAWSNARAKAEANDKSLNIPTGTTESFVRGVPLDAAIQIGISDDNYREMSTKLGVSESSLRLFIAKANKQDNPAVNQIYYVDNNRYLATQDSDTECNGKLVPDDSYLYYDQDGLHYFKSYPEANEYVKAHQDRKFGDFVEEISKALSEKLSSDPGFAVSGSDLESVKGALSNFIANNSYSVFTDKDNLETIETFLSATQDIDPGLFEKFFSRTSIKDSNPSNSVDYLSVLGQSIVKNFASSYISYSLGINIGSSKLTADDIYEIFNGNSKEVFTRIGGAMLDTEIGLEKGTFASILNASSTEAKKCAFERAATKLLGSYINIPGLKLDGSLFDNFGGHRLENLLGFPEGSFSGATITELTDTNRKNYVPLIDFYEGFKLPIPKDVSDLADQALTDMGTDYLNQYKAKSFYEKAKVINHYVEAIGLEQLAPANSGLWYDWIFMQSWLQESLGDLLTTDFLNSADIETMANNLITKSGFAGYTSDQAVSMVKNFKYRLRAIDSSLSLASGRTKALLLGTISPDDFRKEISNSTIGSLTVDIVKKAFGIESDITLNDLRHFKNAITNTPMDGDMSSVYGTTEERMSTIYGFLEKTFSLKLDEKAGFETGTIAKLIAHPSEAPYVLLQQGAKKLDQQLGIDDKPRNFSKYVDIVFGDSETVMNTCNSEPFRSEIPLDQCLNRNRTALVEAGAKSFLKSRIASNLSSVLTDLSGVMVTVTDDDFGTYTEKQHGLVLTFDQLKGVFSGDFRAIAVIGAVRALGSIIGDTDGNYALGNNSSGFMFNAQDVYWAFYSDPDSESYAAQRATQYTYAINNGSNVEIYDNYYSGLLGENGAANIPASPGAQINTNPMATTTNSRDASHLYSDMNYPLPEGTDYSTPIAPTAPEMPMIEDFWYTEDGTGTRRSDEEANAAYNAAMDTYKTENNIYLMKKDNYDRIQSEAATAASEASAEAKKMMRELFEYRASDCMLRKIDKNIPSGFSWNMMKGNGYVRTVTMLSYLENWLREDEGWARALPEGSLPAIYDYLSGPNKGDIDTLIDKTTSGILDMVDDYLIANAPKVFGMSLQPGTAQALFAFVKTGKFDEAVSIGGKEYSFKTVYKDYTKDFIGGKIGSWVDGKLGLPTGTSYGIYKAYKSFQAAKQAYSTASVMADGAAKSTAMSKARADMVQFKAEIVTLIITAIFSSQIADAEEALGLVPGTGAIAVGLLVSLLMGAAINPVALVLFIAINLFGVYRVDVVCTADGYYYGKQDKPDPTKVDVANLGLFNGLNEDIREEKFIQAAQYKSDRLALDLYEMATNTGDTSLTPLQVMTGRADTVKTVAPLVVDTACKAIGTKTLGKASDGTQTAVCSGSRVGIWQNDQATTYTHIGF